MSEMRFLTILVLCALCASQAGAQSSRLDQGRALVKAGKFEEARQVFQGGIKEQDAASIDYLGYLYLEGKGGEQQLDTAKQLFLQAAELGSSQACRNLGNMYYLARGVEPNIEMAMEWYRKGAELGSPRAAFSLGQIHWLGDGFKRSPIRAMASWQSAKRLGSVDADVALIAVTAPTGSATEEELSRLNSHAEKGHVTAVGLLKYLELKREEKPLVQKTRFVHQAYNFCGVASSTMLSQHYGGKLSQFEFAKQRANHKWAHGSHWDELADVAKKLEQDWTIRAFPVTDSGYEEAISATAEILRRGEPVIVDIREDEANPGAHSILAVGYDPDSGELLVLNPAISFPGYQVFSEERLKQVWKSSGYLPSLRKEARAIMYYRQ
jgi:hypothetical protein